MKLTTGTCVRPFWIFKIVFISPVTESCQGGVPGPTSDLSFKILHQRYVDILRVWFSFWEVFRIRYLAYILLWLQEWNFSSWPGVFGLQILTAQPKAFSFKSLLLTLTRLNGLCGKGKNGNVIISDLFQSTWCQSMNKAGIKKISFWLYFYTRNICKNVYLYYTSIIYYKMYYM